MKKPFKLGITGSIATGKSTTAQLFNELGIPVWDADRTVRKLYSANQPGAQKIGQIAPVVIKDGAVDRDLLKKTIQKVPALLGKIEKIIHPLVKIEREQFAERMNTDIIVFDIPLLFETGSDQEMDAVIVTTVSPETQKERALARGTMTEAEFDMILSRQMSESEKRKRADYLIDTGMGLNPVRAIVRDIVKEIRKKIHNDA